MRMRWGHGAWVMAGCLLGCGPLVPIDGATETESASDEGGTTGLPPSNTTTAPPGTTTTPPPPPGTTTIPLPSDESASDGAMTSLVFLEEPDGGILDFECTTFRYDECPRGEKCMPWANDGGSSWNATRCSPIAENPDQVGDHCTVEGSGVSGIDSCAEGSMCWDVDPETLEGHCVAFCVGSVEAPMCEDPNASCVMTSDGPLALCIPRCDPLQQACPEGEACYPAIDTFNCIPDASGDAGAPGDECEFVNVCDPGSACVAPELVPDCMGLSGCCTAFCDVTVDPPPCLPGQECTPWYEAGQAPAGYENVGVCALPT